MSDTLHSFSIKNTVAKQEYYYQLKYYFHVYFAT